MVNTAEYKLLVENNNNEVKSLNDKIELFKKNYDDLEASNSKII